jgi:hypothetical protein
MLFYIDKIILCKKLKNFYCGGLKVHTNHHVDQLRFKHLDPCVY